MNIEHLCRSVLANWHRVKNVKKTLMYVRYQFELLAWKRQKLKLGAIVFEIKKIIIANITIHEDTEIRFIRQDTSQEDDLKIENRLKAIGWKWDVKNVLSLLVVIVLGGIFIYANIYVLYCEKLPTIAFRDPRADELVYYGLESSFVFSYTESFRSLLFLNFWLINTLTDLCIHFDLLF
jgi:hypothetical protein